MPNSTPMNVSIRADRVLECDGQPFFPLQARHLPAGATWREMAEAGFNCFRHLVFGGLNMASAALPDERYGLKICAYLYNRTNPEYESELTATVQRLRALPDLLSYENCNEPAWRPDAPEVVIHPADGLATGYRMLKRLDPRHPVHQAHGIGGTVEALRAYNACADIVGCNPYPVLPPGMRRHIGIHPDGRALDAPDQTLSAVALYTRKMLEVGAGRPVWMQLQAMAWEDFAGPLTEGGDPNPDPAAILYPTYAQMRYMAFADIIAGATGLLFSMYNLPFGSPAWADVRRLVMELSALHDVLAGRTVELPLTATYRNLGFTIWHGVQLLAKEHAGALYSLAANSAFDPAEVTWSGFTGASALEVLGEDRRIPVRNGSATDGFEPYGVHVYRIR